MATMKNIYMDIVKEMNENNNTVFALWDSEFANGFLTFTRKEYEFETDNYLFERLMNDIFEEVDESIYDTCMAIKNESRYTLFINSKYADSMRIIASEINEFFEREYKFFSKYDVCFDEKIDKTMFTAKLILQSLNSFDENFFIIDTEE